jgi:hypothetical protein
VVEDAAATYRKAEVMSTPPHFELVRLMLSLQPRRAVPMFGQAMDRTLVKHKRGVELTLDHTFSDPARD